MKRFDWDIFFAFAALIVITVFAGLMLVRDTSAADDCKKRGGVIATVAGETFCAKVERLQ
jgi:hypothetical protein